MGVTFEIIVLLVLIIANGALAMAEIAVITARKARLQKRAEEGDEKARSALGLANDPGDFLSTVQIGITLVGVLAGAFGGATIANHLASLIATIPALAPYSTVVGVGIVVILITYFTLVLGELVPKRLALNNPEAIAMAVAHPMSILSRLTSPLVKLLSKSSEGVLHLMGVKPKNEPPVTEEEIRVMIDQGTRAGVFEEVEQDMVEAIFRLGDRRVGTLITPRTEVIWLDLDDPIEDIQRKIMSSDYSRFPVAQGSLDHVIGLVQAKDLLAKTFSGEPLNLKSVMVQPLYVPETMPAFKVLELFRESRVHTALVIDEYGGFQGLVSLFDIMEAIVGEIPEIGEITEPEIVQREDGSWLIDGKLPVDEFKVLFHLKGMPDQERNYYQTVGGFVMTYLGHVPEAGDHFEWSGLRFEVMDMDGLRVDKVLIVPGPEEKP
jgi:putative hemolysin